MNWMDHLQPPRRYLLWCGATAVGAVWVSLHGSLPVSLALCGGAVGLAVLCCRRAKPLAAMIAVAAVFLGLGAGYRYVYQTGTAALDGKTDTVVGEIRERRTGCWYTLRITHADHLPTGSRVLLYCPDAAAPELYDTVSAAVTYRELSATGNTYRADRIRLLALPTAYGEEALEVLRHADTGVGFALARTRQSLSRRLCARLPDQEGAVLAAMCLGDTRYISDETQQLFRRCGLPHILVVSGLHLSVIIGAVYGLARLLRLPRKLTLLLTGGAMLLYSGLVGFSPSVCRAGLMALTLLAGRWLRRPADGLNSMGLALCLILLSNPYALYDVGLQLSFSAVGGILALTPRLAERTAAPVKRHPWLRPLQAGLCTTLGASLLLSPFLAGYFGELSWISPLANLVAVPLAGVLLILGCVAILCLGCTPLRWCGQGCSLLAGWMARLLQEICRLLGGSGAMLPVPSGSLRFWWLTVSCVVLSVLLYRRSGWVWRAAGIAVGAFLLLYLGETAVSTGGYTVRIAAEDSSAAVMLQKGNQTLLLVQDGNACAAARRLWQQRAGSGSVAIAVGNGSTADAAAIAELRRTTGAAVVLSGENADWALGQAVDLHQAAPEQPVELWRGFTLTRRTGGWWSVQLENTVLLVSPAAADFVPAEIPEISADGVVFSGEIVYNGCWTAAPERIWVCTRAQRQQVSALSPQPTATVTDTAAVLYTRGQGDWRKRP